MNGQDPGFAPLSPIDGYLPLADHGLIGSGVTAALVGRDGAIPWLCVPRFDADPLFCALLDARSGGRFLVAPEGVVAARQRYLEDTAVLVTELRTRDTLVRLTDALVLDAASELSVADAPGGGTAGSSDGATDGAPERARGGSLVRRAEVHGGPVRLRVEVEPHGGVDAARAAGGGIGMRWRGMDLALTGTRELPGLRSRHELSDGERLQLVLSWGGAAPEPDDGLLEETAEAWRRWTRHIHYVGPRPDMVRRSAITLKLLDHAPNGAILAAPTSSLPESIGGVRNWDYRYTWIRDAAFSVYAMRRIGLEREAGAFLRWVLDTAGEAQRPCVVYDIDGARPVPERTDEGLEGYRGSAPVRWGNAAAEQRQHDVYGEVLDCAFQWVARGGSLSRERRQRLCALVEGAAREWREPDHGIWEVRTSGQPFTYSVALCQVALDRGVRLAERFGMDGDPRRWRRTADQIVDEILDLAWNEERQALVAQLDGAALDASVLALPLRRVVPADHPRMVATTDAVARGLSAGGGLLYRYLPEEQPDGLPGEEGAFLLCSFWLADNLVHQGRVEEAHELYASMCGRSNDLGLLPEQIDPSTGGFLGNFPQALSHVGLIASAVTLTRGMARGEDGGRTRIPLQQALRTAVEEAPPPAARLHATDTG